MLLLTSIEIVQWNYSLEPAGTIPFLQPVWNLGPTILGQGLQDTPANSRFPPPSVSRPGWKSSCHQCYPRVVCMERHPGHTTLEKGHQLVTIGQTDEEQETSILNGYNPKTTRDFSLLPNVPENRAMIGNFNRRDSIWEDRFSTITVAIGEQLQDAEVILLNDGESDKYSRRNTSAINISFVSTCIAGRAEWSMLGDIVILDHPPTKITIHLTPILHYPSYSEQFYLQEADWKSF